MRHTTATTQVESKPRSMPSYGDEHPFAQQSLGRRVLPFGVVAAIAEASLALPPGPRSMGYTTLSVVLLVAVALAMFLLPWERLPETITVLVPVAYAGSVLTLVLAAGGSTSGVGIVILIPLIWTALYHRRSESTVVVAAIVATQVVTSLIPVEVAGTVLLRRMVFWSALGFLVSVATHDLRDRLRRILNEREDAFRQTDGLKKAAEELTTIRASNDVVTTATRLAAQLASPPGSPGRRALYTRVVGSMVTIVAQYDEAGQTVITVPLADHPGLAEAMRTGRSVSQSIKPGEAGATTQHALSSLGVANGVYVPVYVEREIDGVLSVSVSDRAISPDLFECCKAIGHLTELALGNARTHETLAAEATTDPLTGVANRRVFDQTIAERPGRQGFSVITVDVDGLKQVNDTEGHTAGDQLLVHVSRVLLSTLRRGDLLARLGGDEFAVLLFDAEEDDGIKAAERMLAALAEAPFRGVPCRVSIGVASGGPDADGQCVYAAADRALYQAKRDGGHRYAVTDRSLAATPDEPADKILDTPFQPNKVNPRIGPT